MLLLLFLAYKQKANTHPSCMLLSICETESKHKSCFLFHIETESKRNCTMFMLLFHIETGSKRKCYHVIVTVSHRNRKQTQIRDHVTVSVSHRNRKQAQMVTLLLLLFHIGTESKHKMRSCYCHRFT